MSARFPGARLSAGPSWGPWWHLGWMVRLLRWSRPCAWSYVWVLISGPSVGKRLLRGVREAHIERVAESGVEEQNVAQPLDSGEAPPTASVRMAPPRAEPSLSNDLA